jgi:hypothetical protein
MSLVAELPSVAKIVDFVVDATAYVVMVNLAETEPAAMNTYVGTEAHELLDDRKTSSPYGPARPVSVTVPIEFCPPSTLAGEIWKERMPGGTSVKFAVFSTPPNTA